MVSDPGRRAVTVDARGILEALAKVDHAERLVAEIQSGNGRRENDRPPAR
jgi:hypothetical protein